MNHCMSAESESDTEPTWKSISLHRDVYSQLKASKPYDSMSYNDLVVDMLEDYEGSEERP